MTRRESARVMRLHSEFEVLHAYQRHYGSTQREDAAADLRMGLETFRAILEDARRHGFDIEAAPDTE